MYVQRGLNFWHKQYIEQYRASIETNVSTAWECSTLQARKAGNRQTLTRSMHSAGWFKGKCYRQTEEWKRTRIIQVSVYTRLRPFSWYFKSALLHGKINELRFDRTTALWGLWEHILRGSANAPLREIWLLAAKWDIVIHPFWIEGKRNRLVNTLSHFDKDKLTRLCSYWQNPSHFMSH